MTANISALRMNLKAAFAETATRCHPYSTVALPHQRPCCTVCDGAYKLGSYDVHRRVNEGRAEDKCSSDRRLNKGFFYFKQRCCDADKGPLCVSNNFLPSELRFIWNATNERGLLWNNQRKQNKAGQSWAVRDLPWVPSSDNKLTWPIRTIGGRIR